MDDTLSGPPGLRALSRVVEELSSAIVCATIRRLQTEENYAEDLIKKHRHVPLEFAQQQVNIDGTGCI